MRRVPVLLSWVLVVGCREATQVTVEITTNLGCELEGTTFASGTLAELRAPIIQAETSACAVLDGDLARIGSIVLVPSGDGGDTVAMQVVTGVDRAPTACDPATSEGCIFARRVLRFIPHTSLELPILMDRDCLGVPCALDETCFDGRCASATVDDPSACTEPGGCDPVPPPPECTPLTSQPSHDHSVAFAGDGQAETKAVAADVAGNAWAAGTAAGETDFGVGASCDDANDTFIASFDPAGAPRFARCLGGVTTTQALAAQPDGGMLLAGTLSGELSDMSITSTGSGDPFVISFAPNGDPRWAQTLTGPTLDVAHGVAVDAAGDIYVSGYFSGSISAGDTLLGEFGVDGFVAKLSADAGTPLWAKQFQTTMFNGDQFRVAAASQVYVTGTYGDTVNLGGGQLGPPDADSGAFVGAYDADGNDLWAIPLGPAHIHHAVIAAADDSVVVGGSFLGNLTVEELTVSSNLGDAFLLKLRPNGSAVWLLRYGDTLGDIVLDVELDADGNVYATGGWSDGADVFVVSVDPDGVERWFFTTGGAGAQAVNGLAVAGGCRLLVGGSFDMTAHFGGPTFTSQGAMDGYLVQLTSQ